MCRERPEGCSAKKLTRDPIRQSNAFRNKTIFLINESPLAFSNARKEQLILGGSERRVDFSCRSSGLVGRTNFSSARIKRSIFWITQTMPPLTGPYRAYDFTHTLTWPALADSLRL